MLKCKMTQVKFCICNSLVFMALAFMAGLAHGDHERSAQVPWWPQFEAERLAVMETPGGMMSIPAGWFLMGSDPYVDRNAGPQELPQRWVYLDEFAMDRYEVSNVHYLRFVMGAGASVPPYWKDGAFPDKLAFHPVIGVSWEEADTYCRWAGKRLPTEAEWEKAARGPDGRLFPWGNQPAGWGRSNIAHPGSKRGVKYPPLANVDRYDRGRSVYGVYQMAGNVAEWVADWFDPEYYQRGTNYNPDGPVVGQERVFRGGSWNEDPEVARSAGRGARVPDHRSYLIGFRCAADNMPSALSHQQSVVLKGAR
jgi:iron(II)-dependent oxidoreductase